MPISDREQRAATFLQKYGLLTEKLKEKETKTPDFRVVSSDGFVAHAEVKVIQGPGRDEPLLWQQLYNGITNHMHTAVKQFDAVNSDQIDPNILIFLAEDFRFHWKSFLDFFRGAIVIEDQLIADLGRFRFGRVKSDLLRVDLFILLDTADTPSFFFTGSNPHFLPRLTSRFRCEAFPEENFPR